MNELASLIDQIQFFKDKNIKEKDMLELMNVFNFVKAEAEQDVMKYGDTGNLFYLIVKGKVSVRVPNLTKIRGWKSQWNEY